VQEAVLRVFLVVVALSRLCVNSLQFLPHTNYPTDQIFKGPLDRLEFCCNTAALSLDSYQRQKPSLLRIRQLLIYIPILYNVGKPEESSAVLQKAAEEAQSISLFLEKNELASLNSKKKLEETHSGISTSGVGTIYPFLSKPCKISSTYGTAPL
jgi:hypothetical protein